MFTGLIEDLGTITHITTHTVNVTTCLNDIRIGDSVAVNGVCLTVTEIIDAATNRRRLSFDYTPETYAVTTLSQLRTGSRVNLERALHASSRLGGHIVSGHVEAVGTLMKISRIGNSHILRFSLPAAIARYVVAKGSIAIDGISLTVVDATDAWFTVSIIPHTMTHTTLSQIPAGAKVNLEADILARYHEKSAAAPSTNRLTERFLKENGFV